MKGRRRFLLAAAGLASASVLAREPERVRFWAMGREGQVVRELLRDFERDHPEIRLDIQGLPWTAAHEKLLTALAADAVPDLCQRGHTWIPDFAALGALEPPDPSVATACIDEADYCTG